MLELRGRDKPPGGVYDQSLSRGIEDLIGGEKCVNRDGEDMEVGSKEET